MSLFLLLAQSSLPSVTGDLAATESGSDTASFAGSVIDDIQGDLAATEASDTASVAGLVETRRYWVGGTGTWDASSTTNWSTSSGGASGASAPTSTDTVIFDENSNTGTNAFTVTTSGTRSFARLDATSVDSTLFTFTTGGSLSCGGDFLLPASNVAFSGIYTLNLVGTGSHTLSVGGSTNSTNEILLNTTGTYTLGSGINGNKTLRVTQGTFNTANYNLNLSNLSSEGTSTRVINFGSSTITIGTTACRFYLLGSNLTVNAGTSLITTSSTSTGMDFQVSGQTLYDVTIQALGVSTQLHPEMWGSFTCNDLTLFSPSTSVLRNEIMIQGGSTITVNGLLSVEGESEVARVLVRNGWGDRDQVTIIASNYTLSYADFAGINAQGSPAWSGTSIGNASGNNGITFTAAKTVYGRFTGGSDSTSDANSFSLTSGGAGANANYPLPQDTLILDDNTLSSTVNIATSFGVATLDCSARTTALTVAYSTGCFFGGDSGSLILSSAITTTENTAEVLIHTPDFSINYAGTQVKNTINVLCKSYGSPIGTVRVLANTQFGDSGDSTPRFKVSCGRFDANGFTITAYGAIIGAVDIDSLQAERARSEIYLNGGVIDFVQGAAQITYNEVQNFYQEPNTWLNITGGTGTETFTITGAAALTSQTNNGQQGLPKIKAKATLDIGQLALTGSSYQGELDLSLNSNGGALAGGWFANSLTVNSAMTVTATATAIGFFGDLDSTVNWNGVTADRPLTINRGNNSTLTLASNYTATTNTRLFAFESGKLDLAGYTVAMGVTDFDSTTNKTVTFNGGTIKVIGATYDGSPSGNVIFADPQTGFVEFTYAAGAITAQLGTSFSKMPTLKVSTSQAIAFTTTTSVYIYDIVNTVQPASVSFSTNTTAYFDNFSLRGTSGNLVTVQSSSGTTTTTFSKTSGIVDCDYLALIRTNATGGASWYAGLNSTSVTNTGWIFTSAVRTITGNNVVQNAVSGTGEISQAGTVTLTANSVAQSATSGTGSITQDHVLTSNSVTQNATSGTGAISRTLELTGNSVSQSATSSTGAVVLAQTLTANNVSQSATSGTGAVSQIHALTGNSVASNATSGTGAITQIQILLGNSVSQSATSTTGAVVLAQTITGNNVSQSATSSTGAISQAHVLLGNNTFQSATSGTGSITQTHVLTGNNAAQTALSPGGSISQAGDLTANNVSQTAVSGTGSITQAHILTGNSVSQSATSTTGAVSQANILTGNSVSQAATSSTGAVVVSHVLTGNNVTQTALSGTGAIVVEGAKLLTGNSVTQSSLSAVGAIVQIHILTGNSVAQTATSTAGAISKTLTLTGNGVSQTNQSTTGAVDQTITLVASGASQSATSGTGQIVVLHDLTGTNVSQAGASTTGAISQVHFLAGASVQQTPLSPGGTIIQGPLLYGNNVTQSAVSGTGAIEVIIIERAPTGTGYAPLDLSSIARPAQNISNRPKQSSYNRTSANIRKRT